MNDKQRERREVKHRARRLRWLTPALGESWFPNFPDGRVRAKVGGPERDGKFRVSVWGDDDFGMEREGFDTEEEALRVFDSLPDVIEKQHLRALGFVNA